ncbi:type VI secretion system protein TssA [Pseudoxanthomonas putridarboris]|uniref:Type VI secretion system protein TssA n=1 Tax=Pseudoxanthomonas putridarboris TaxID=752605 RepID=A0ABU9J543_9GAMM
MTIPGIETLLLPIDEQAPAGANLEYHPDFLALEQAASPLPERGIGNSVRHAEEPDWNDVAARGERLLAQTRDLRIAVHVATAWLNVHGLPGWSAGLGLVRGFLECFWEDVHPVLDKDEDGDPTERINAIAAIGSATGMLAYFRNTRLFRGAHPAHFSLRDLRIATGTLKPAAGEAGEEARPGMLDMDACCQECPLEHLLEVKEALDHALDHAQAINRVFEMHTPGAGPDLEPLVRDVRELHRFIDQHAAQRTPRASVEEALPGNASGSDPSPAERHGHAIENPHDVVRRLDELCDYYARSEPSSPVPLLLRRAQRLVGMNFVDLMKELAPGGISELQVISGRTDEN